MNRDLTTLEKFDRDNVSIITRVLAGVALIMFLGSYYPHMKMENSAGLMNNLVGLGEILASFWIVIWTIYPIIIISVESIEVICCRIKEIGKEIIIEIRKDKKKKFRKA